ncbi:MAG: hypothetical protein WC541_09405 [Dehalococcoidia bacterium]
MGRHYRIHHNQYDQYLFSYLTRRTRFDEAAMRPQANATAPGQQGCGLNPSGRWPERISSRIGADFYGRSYGPTDAYGVPVGTNGLRPGEYALGDTDLTAGPYSGNMAAGTDIPTAQAEAQKQLVLQQQMQQDATVSLINSPQNQSLLKQLNPEPIVPYLNTQQSKDWGLWPGSFGQSRYGNQYHIYNTDNMIAEWDKANKNFFKETGLNPDSMGI